MCAGVPTNSWIHEGTIIKRAASTLPRVPIKQHVLSNLKKNELHSKQCSFRKSVLSSKGEMVKLFEEKNFQWVWDDFFVFSYIAWSSNFLIHLKPGIYIRIYFNPFNILKKRADDEDCEKKLMFLQFLQISIFPTDIYKIFNLCWNIPPTKWKTSNTEKKSMMTASSYTMEGLSDFFNTNSASIV